MTYQGTTLLSQRLFWSRRGDVACEAHAPAADSERWLQESWSAIPESAAPRHGLIYQCPQCARDGRVHRHVGRTLQAR